MKRYFYTDQFKKLYKRLPEAIKRKLQRQLRQLAQDQRHPSLKVRKMVNRDDVWEARVDVHYRFTFKIDGDQIILKSVGRHEIYRKF